MQGGLPCPDRRHHLRFFLNFRLCLFAGLLPKGLLRLTVTLLLYAVVSVSVLSLVIECLLKCRPWPDSILLALVLAFGVMFAFFT